MDDSNQHRSPNLQEFGFYINICSQFAFTILVGLGGGWWIDKKFDLSPIFTIIGTFLCAVIGFYSLYRSLIEKLRK